MLSGSARPRSARGCRRSDFLRRVRRASGCRRRRRAGGERERTTASGGAGGASRCESYSINRAMRRKLAAWPKSRGDGRRANRADSAVEPRWHARRQSLPHGQRAVALHRWRRYARGSAAVVGERGDGDNRRHGRIFAGRRAPCQIALAEWFATPLGPLSARARAGVFRPDRRRHLRLPRDPDRPAGVPVPRAEPDRRRAGPSIRSRRRSCSPIRSGCRSPRTRSTSSCCRMRSNSRPSRTQLLREVYRTVRPEGQVVIAGFNPFSLFGAKRYFGRGETPPWNGNFIALYRLEGLARAARLRGDRRQPRLLRAAVRAGEMAAPLRVLRACGRSLVADRAAASISCGRPRRSSACASSRPHGSAARTHRHRPAAGARMLE